MLEKDKCDFLSITTLPQSSFCIRLKKLLQFAQGGKTTNALFEGFKGKDSFFVSEWLRQKALEILCEKLES